MAKAAIFRASTSSRRSKGQAREPDRNHGRAAGRVQPPRCRDGRVALHRRRNARRHGPEQEQGRRSRHCRRAQHLLRLVSRRALDASKRSEEHTSELQSLMRISYAVFCLKKKKTQRKYTKTNNTK